MPQCRCGPLEVLGKSTITGRFQLTLPKHVRELLRAENGDLIVFIKDQDNIMVKRGTLKIED
jgi:AbrB family looped-hinge helix DNA binding protein